MKKIIIFFILVIAGITANAQYIKVNREIICPGEYAALSTDTMVKEVNIGDIICYNSAGDTIIVTVSNWNYYSSIGYTALSVVFFVDSTGQHGWAAGSISQSRFYIGDGEYDEIYVNFPNYFSTPHEAIRDINGQTNTESIRNGPNFNTTDNPAIPSPPFYLPALGQLNYFYTQYVTLNSIYQSIWGESSLPAIQTNNRFWTSTGHWNSEEYDDVWCLLLPFNPVFVDGLDYSESYYVLPVMDF